MSSEASVKLTTKAFALLKDNPAMGRAEAMRQSMQALIGSQTRRQSHPAYWAPFVVVGEGGTGR